MIRHKAKLTQKNKSFKGSVRQSNSLEKKQQLVAKAAKSAVVFGKGGNISKTLRVQIARNLKKNKQKKAVEKKTVLQTPAPKFVLIVPFHNSVNALEVKNELIKAMETDELCLSSEPLKPETRSLPLYAQGPAGARSKRVTFLDCSRDLHAALDAAKCADIMVAVFREASLDQPAFDETGYKLLSAFKEQGLPLTLGVSIPCVQDASKKQKIEKAKLVMRYFQSEFGNDKKFFPLDSDGMKAKELLRAIGNMTPYDFPWRQTRGYMFANSMHFVSEKNELHLEGYVCGLGFSTKLPIHLTGHGDFCVSEIWEVPDPCHVKDRKRELDSHMKSDGNSSLRLLKSHTDDSAEELSFEMKCLQPYDPSNNEQTWPSDAELADADRRGRGRKNLLSTIPAPEATEATETIEAGTANSNDNNIWMDDAENFGNDDDNFSEDGNHDNDDNDDNDDRRCSEASSMEDDDVDFCLRSTEEMGTESVKVRSQEDMEFPDEVDIPPTASARHRLQKYRGLASFKTSFWHPYEDLPVEYSRIFTFEDFYRSRKASILGYKQTALDIGTSGRYCRLVIVGVPESVVSSHPIGFPWVVSSLLSLERKVTVVHLNLSRVNNDTPLSEKSIPSKQLCEIHCGFRRISGTPIFSSCATKGIKSEKVKFLRFFHPKTSAVASVYCPTIMPPCPALLIMTDESTGCQEIVACGSVMPPAPNRMIIKRIVLTAQIFKSQKRKAIARHMFFTPQDIRWFKPVELHTKKRLRGHIKESIGTRGYMKCCFNNIVDQSDTICMFLYKRQYPKWFPLSWGGDANLLSDDCLKIV